jgi:transposase
MKRGNSSQRSLKQVAKAGHTRSMTIGVDLGDKNSCYCVLDSNGVIVEESRVGTTKASIRKAFGSMPYCRVAVKVGTHSPWVSRLLHAFGHEVIIAKIRGVERRAQGLQQSSAIFRPGGSALFKFDDVPADLSAGLHL